MTRILIATDGSDVSTEAVHHVVKVLHPTEVELFVLSVLRPAATAASAPKRAEYYEEAVYGAQRAVNTIMHDLAIGHFKAFGLTRVGDAGPAIVEAAKDLRADFIILGAHGHDGLEALVRESTSAYVFEHAPCGVMVYPHRVAQPA